MSSRRNGFLSNKFDAHKLRELLDSMKEKMYEIPATYIHDKASTHWHSFKHYVEHNKKWMRFSEDALTKMSFFLPGRWGDSGELGEFVYGLGGVLQTLNDRALNEESNTSVFCGGREMLSIQNIKTLVKLLQHMQLFIELLAIKNLSPVTRWKVILLIEFIKMLCRLYLLYYVKGHMLIMQNEDEMKYHERMQQAEHNDNKYANLQKMYVQHGRGTDPNGFWSPLSKQQQHLVNDSSLMDHVRVHCTKYPQKQGWALKRTMFAEILHIIRPVVYVASLLKYAAFGGHGNGTTQWYPFIISLLMDIYSQMAHFTTNILSERQKVELARRRKYWLFYILRPPFFTEYIESYLKSSAKALQEKKATLRYW
eukprot:CAMPEP_0202693702 /NCGR_PEP_ID=MMETSP1385-20130828/7746_1 /ASSEMBLY_ACC=CAM_ASM_000861 /TAXON_ID=933848 /ORGANISM="Elphidium margaritaceum" /LENGTH=366 /DNA_ID=CAMNT_0049349419 /DNA_START=1 /DNA_END=1098 /DNA_ORIENTATION=+